MLTKVSAGGPCATHHRLTQAPKPAPDGQVVAVGRSIATQSPLSTTTPSANEQTVAGWKTTDGRQSGDPAKLAAALVKRVDRDQPPLRFPAGADAVATIEQKGQHLSLPELTLIPSYPAASPATTPRTTADQHPLLPLSVR
jgi:hypothetical protein